MTRAERTLRAALAGVGAFAVGYLLAPALRLPVPVYHPLERSFRISAAPAGLEMRYYGDLSLAVAAGLLGSGASWALQQRRSPVRISAATALSLVALEVAWYLSRLLAAG